MKSLRSHCPIALALEVLGDKWTLLILRDLLGQGKRHYQEFLNSEEGISTNILADRLARLEERGIISKAQDPDDKKRFLYAPTQKGLDLLPTIFELARWGLKYDPHADRTAPMAQRFMADEAGLRKDMLSRFRSKKARSTWRFAGEVKN